MHAPVGNEAAQRQKGSGPTSGAGTNAPAIQRTVESALEALDRRRIAWALLRGEAELGTPTGDVDILCAAVDLPRLENALAPLGFGRLRTYGRGSHSFFVAYDEADDCWIKLDVVTKLEFGRYQELRFDSGAGCLARRRRAGRLVLLAADDAFWTLLLHCLLDRRTFSGAQRRRLMELAGEASTDGPLALALEETLSAPRQANELLELVAAGDWTRLERHGPQLRAGWIRGSVAVRTRLVRNAFLRRAGTFPPFCGTGLILRAAATDSAFAAAVADRWYLPHRFVRQRGSRAGAIRSLIVARWHAARGRLVVLDLPDVPFGSRTLDRLSGASALTSVVDATSTQTLPAATARLWRLYSRRTA
jgi:hypothetical protein